MYLLVKRNSIFFDYMNYTKLVIYKALDVMYVGIEILFKNKSVLTFLKD